MDLHTISLQILTAPLGDRPDVYYFPHFTDGQLKLWEVKCFAQGHRVKDWVRNIAPAKCTEVQDTVLATPVVSLRWSSSSAERQPALGSQTLDLMSGLCLLLYVWCGTSSWTRLRFLNWTITWFGVRFVTLKQQKGSFRHKPCLQGVYDPVHTTLCPSLSQSINQSMSEWVISN